MPIIKVRARRVVKVAFEHVETVYVCQECQEKYVPLGATMLVHPTETGTFIKRPVVCRFKALRFPDPDVVELGEAEL